MAELIEKIEARFKEVTGLIDLDLSNPHFERGDNQQQKTTKEEFKKWGFVTTPIWLVDEMIEPNMDKLELTSKTCDACCGCGQFSVRMMRKLYDKYIKLGASPDKMNAWIEKIWLEHLHYFTEFQYSNVAKLVYVFGPDINVYIGDSLNLKYSTDDNKGLLFFDGERKEWFNIPEFKERIVKYKDDLPTLIGIFKKLEGMEVKKREPKKEVKVAESSKSTISSDDIDGNVDDL